MPFFRNRKEREFGDEDEFRHRNPALKMPRSALRSFDRGAHDMLLEVGEAEFLWLTTGRLNILRLVT